MTNDYFINDLKDSIHSEITNQFQNRQDYHGTSFLMQPYVQWKYKQSQRLTYNLGVHGQYFTLNGSTSIEPRAGLNFNVNEKQTLNFGLGLHSQMLPAYVYYMHLPSNSATYVLHNKNVGFMKSAHSILGYDIVAAKICTSRWKPIINTSIMFP